MTHVDTLAQPQLSQWFFASCCPPTLLAQRPHKDGACRYQSRPANTNLSGFGLSTPEPISTWHKQIALQSAVIASFNYIFICTAPNRNKGCLMTLSAGARGGGSNSGGERRSRAGQFIDNYTSRSTGKSKLDKQTNSDRQGSEVQVGKVRRVRKVLIGWGGSEGRAGLTGVGVMQGGCGGRERRVRLWRQS